MIMGADAVRLILRAFAEAADGPFRSLEQELIRRSRESEPRRGLRIYRLAGTDDAYMVYGLQARRMDREEASWSVGLIATPTLMKVSGEVEVTVPGDESFHSAYERSETTEDPSRGAELLAEFAADVCQHHEWLQASPS